MTTPKPNARYRLADGTVITIKRVLKSAVVIEGEYDPPRRWWFGDDWMIYLAGAELIEDE
jgi:hypothetical protein